MQRAATFRAFDFTAQAAWLASFRGRQADKAGQGRAGSVVGCTRRIHVWFGSMDGGRDFIDSSRFSSLGSVRGQRSQPEFYSGI